MAEKNLIISPKTRIGELLEAYPQLEEVLISMSPVFEKLKNPVLRKTVARVATIQQVSVVGGIPVEQIVNRLRKEVGQMPDETADTQTSELIEKPAWFAEDKIADTFNATTIINSGESPMSEVLRRANLLQPGQILELRTPFLPAPILDMLREKKFLVWSVQKGAEVFNYITRG